jgi:copper(I)-binding protein
MLLLGEKVLVRYIFASVGLVLLAAAWFGVATTTSDTGIQVEDVWVEETDARRVVLQLKITSTGRVADRIVRVSTDGLAGGVAFFDSFGQPTEEIRIPADSHWILGNGAPRVELVGLTRPLKPHDNFPVMLVFKSAGKFLCNARVERASSLSLRGGND